MISYEQYQRIKSLHAHEKLSISQIATELGLSRRTVSHWLLKERYRSRRQGPRKSKLDPYKLEIKKLLARYPYTATQIYQRLTELGYSGGYSIVKDYLQMIRPPRKPTAYLTLTFGSGEAAQVDWGEFGSIEINGRKRKLSFFLMVLCHSRTLYLEFSVRQTMEHFLSCHQNAFEFLGMVPRKVIVDNLKSAVIRRLVGSAPVLNARYLDFAQHYGFEIVPCNPGAPHEKGRVENGVGYVKKNLLRGLDIPTFTELPLLAASWRDSVANIRLHGETKKRPIDLLPEDQYAGLPLPTNRYDVGVVYAIRATRRFRIQFDTNRYSVPAEYAGVRLTVKAYPDRLCIYYEDRLIARHLRSYETGVDIENPDHVRELLSQRRNAKAQKLLGRFFRLSPHAEKYYAELSSRHLQTTSHVEKILALAEIHGTAPVCRAMEDARTFHAYGADYIQHMVLAYTRILVEPQPLTLTRNHDLLDLDMPEPDLSLYETTQGVHDEDTHYIQEGVPSPEPNYRPPAPVPRAPIHQGAPQDDE